MNDLREQHDDHDHAQDVDDDDIGAADVQVGGDEGHIRRTGRGGHQHAFPHGETAGALENAAQHEALHGVSCDEDGDGEGEGWQFIDLLVLLKDGAWAVGKGIVVTVFDGISGLATAVFGGMVFIAMIKLLLR